MKCEKCHEREAEDTCYHFTVPWAVCYHCMDDMHNFQFLRIPDEEWGR